MNENAAIGRSALRRATPAIAGALAIALAAAVAPAAAAGAGTGDDPRRTRDVLTRVELAAKRALEAERHVRTRSSGVAPLAVDTPYGYLYTPSHKQERSYWCGPATMQIIDDYHGAYVSQGTYAAFMGTGTAGTDFSLADDCLRKYTGIGYYYYGGLTESSFNGKVAHSISGHYAPVATDVKISASVWPRYARDHAGHIIPIEAYDWRSMTIRINDCYNESDYYAGGGKTYGHMTYAQDVIWHGVYNHFRRAVVAVP